MFARQLLHDCPAACGESALTSLPLGGSDCSDRFHAHAPVHSIVLAHAHVWAQDFASYACLGSSSSVGLRLLRVLFCVQSGFRASLMDAVVLASERSAQLAAKTA